MKCLMCGGAGKWYEDCDLDYGMGFWQKCPNCDNGQIRFRDWLTSQFFEHWAPEWLVELLCDLR